MNFNIGEVFDMAIQIEVNGAKFYRTAAELMKENKKANQLLVNLAEMEDGHEVLFKKMKDQFVELESSETYFDPNGEAALYLNSFVDGKVFDVNEDVSKLLTGEESLEELLKFSIQREKDTIAFFMGMRELVPEELGSKKVRELILEEMGHIVLLNNKIKELC
jgi:rubrerythrin